MELLHANDMGDVPVFIGGIIPGADIPVLEKMGVAGVFGPGTNTEVIVVRIREMVQLKDAE
jgi:methylmalonyl-CoA mutase C-terminal domain/subunit